jgi:Kef-type K+ transport system membrane component KefB
VEYFFNHLSNEFQRPLQNQILVFSIILFVILLAPIVLKKINIPGIIGLILAGVALGPHSLNVIEKNEAIKLFSTIGLLYIMFIAGLELDMNDFKKNSNKSLTFGLLTFIIPIAIGYPVCKYLLGYDINASFLTASMFATHTLVAYPIVSKFGIVKNQAIGVTVGGTILTDTAVLLILAIIISNSEGKLDSAFLVRLSLSLLIFGLIMFVALPPFARWFFNRLESEHHSHYIFVLAIVFFAAFLSEVAGVEPIIGAFMAGLALNKLIPHSSALMNRIEFIGNSLFIPFFLFSVGMVVDPSVLMKGSSAWIVAITLTTFAIFSKWVAAFMTQKIFNYSADQRQLIFGLSSAHAAATLAIILVGFKQGILDENILNGTIILILVTCIVASFATEKAAKSILSKDDSTNGLDEIKYELTSEHILIPIEENDNVDNIINLASTIKSRKSAQPISLLSIVDYDDDSEINLIKEKRRLGGTISNMAALATKINFISTIDHNSGSGISRTSREIMANLILMAWPSSQTIIDRFMGDRIDSIINYTDKTVFICDLPNPFISNERLILVLPPLAEKENGFTQSITKSLLIAKNLNLSVACYCEQNTFEEIKNIDSHLGYNLQLKHSQFTEWEDLLILGREIKDSDFLIVFSARKGSASYISILDSIPVKLERNFKNNKVLIYPQQFSNLKIFDNYLDINAEPISKGINTFKKLTEGLLGKK